MRRTRSWPSLPALLALCVACTPPGKPAESDRYVRPNQVTDFSAIYARNCAGCHGENGTAGPARPLADPLYLAWAGRDAIRETIDRGVPGTSMPAWSQRRGGPLSEAQIDALTEGMFTRWGDADVVRGVALPPYRARASGAGDLGRGARAYATFCSGCHGEDGRGARGGSVVDPALLALASDQMLRTTAVAGRVDLGMPDWRGYVPGRVMTPREIRDLVAWLRAQERAEVASAPLARAAEDR